MECGGLSFAVNHEKASKNGPIKKVKRKFSSVLNESYGISPIIKKRKLLKISDNSRHYFTNHGQCENTNNYFKVIANSEEAVPPPLIFQNNHFKVDISKITDSFLLKFLSAKIFNSNVNVRFRQENFNSPRDTNNYTKKERKNNNDCLNEAKEKKAEKQSTVAVRQEMSERNKSSGEDDLEGISHVDVYRVTQRKALIFHMKHPSKFSFHGEIKATILSGEVEILGYTLSQASCKTSVDVYSPNFCTALIVETKANSKPNQLIEVQDRLKPFLTEDDVSTLLTKFKPNDSLLFVEQIISNLGIVLNKYFDKVLFPKDLEDVSSMTETMKSLQSIFTFKLPKEGKHFRKNPQWDKVPLGHCTVLCGGKGVGKSMLLKYYINRLLTVGEKVMVLDFDPGQPEFTFPGCLSAVVVEEPVMGPNFTHVTEPLRMVSFGDVDVAKNPTKYLECVRYITDSCKENEELQKMKWLVNTMGFSKGLGVDLMITILKLLNPNTVVQIKGSDFKNNYPFYLTPATVNAKTGFWSMPLEDVSLSYDLRVVSSSAERDKRQVQGGLKRKQLRDIMSVSYFSKMVSPPFYNFNAVQPYLISFSKIYLGVDFLVNPNDVVKAFNGNTVFLSHFEPNGEEILSVAAFKDEYFQIVVKPQICPSVGVGFIRGIDCAERKFYVLTHLPMATLDGVNCLSLGRVSPPHCMFLRQEAVENKTVYTTTCTVDIIKSVKRMFRVPGTLLEKEKVVPKL